MSATEDIYDKLRTAPTYHPSSVELFDSCELDAGDIVTVKSDTDEYTLPVFGKSLVWNGASVVTLQSTGNEERSPLPELKRRSYGAGRGAYQNQLEDDLKFQQFQTFFDQTDEYFSWLATQSEWDEIKQAGVVTAYSRLTMTAQGLASEVTRATESEGTLSSRITQNATAITTKVSAGDIASTINQTAQSVLIQADKIDLQGYVTASELSATNANISNLTSGNTRATTLKANLLDASVGFTYQETPVRWVPISIGNVVSYNGLSSASAAVDLDHSHSITMSESGGVVTATLGPAVTTSDSGRTANFNIADTSYYQNGVSAARAAGKASVTMSAGGWTGGSNTITASNGGTLILSAPTIAVDSSQYVSGIQYSIAVDVGGANQTVVISAQDAYDAGAAAGGGTITKGTWSSGSVDFTTGSDTKSVNLSQGTVSWNTGRVTIPILDDGVETGLVATDVFGTASIAVGGAGWYNDSQYVSSYTNFGDLAYQINNHTTNGYAVFYVRVKGVTKYYRLSINAK